MRVLVTGATGFLGRHVVAAFLAKGDAVRLLVRPAAKIEHFNWPNEVQVFRADLRDSSDLLPAFEPQGDFGPIDCLVHLAAAVTGSEETQFAAGVVGTERLLGAMARSATRRIVLASSLSVYDWSHSHSRLSERSPVESDIYSRDGYAIAKFWQERVAGQYAQQHNWDLTILRPGFIWGFGNTYPACLGQRVGRLHLVFAPKARPPLTYVENCADAFVTVAGDTRALGRTYNVIDGDLLNSWELLQQHLRGTDASGWCIPIPYRLAHAGTKAAQIISRAIFREHGGKLPSILVPRRFEARFKPLTFEASDLQLQLGWKPPVSMSEALERAFIKNSTVQGA